jgi:hypothetical protein
VIGAVGGAIFGGKDKKQTSAQQLDPTVQRYRDQMLSQASGLAGRPAYGYGGQLTAGLDPMTQQAAGIFGGLSGLAGLGAGALSGDPNARAQFMNPYQSGVLDAVGQQYSDMRDQATLGINDQATKAGAFGGSRHGVAQGQLLGDLYKAEGQQKAGLIYGGFNDAMQRAQQALGMGMGAAGQLGQYGQYATGLQQQNQQNQYNEWLRQQQQPYQQLAAMQGAVGTAGALGGGTTTQSTPGSGILGGAVGGAMVGAGLQGMLGGGQQPSAPMVTPSYFPSNLGFGYNPGYGIGG